MVLRASNALDVKPFVQALHAHRLTKSSQNFSHPELTNRVSCGQVHFTGVNETSYEKMLSRARKYELCLTLAHQQTGQIPKLLMREILGNVSTLIAFNVSHVDATQLTQEYPVDMGREITYVPVEEFVSLKVGEAWGKIGKSVFPLKTALAPQQPDFTRTKTVIERSQGNYGIKSLPTATTNGQKPVEKAVAVAEDFPFDETQVF